MPWKTFFKDFVGGSDSIFSVGFVVEPLLPLSVDRLRCCSAAMRLSMLRCALETRAVAWKQGLRTRALVARQSDPSHVLLVCEKKEKEEEGQGEEEEEVKGFPCVEEWMHDLSHPNWAPCRALEKTLRLLRSEYRSLSGDRLQLELQSVSVALLREECVLLLLCSEELFVQHSCDPIWKRISVPEFWKSVLRPRMEQFGARSVARALFRRPSLWSLVDAEYAASLLCDSDEGLVLEAARMLPIVKNMTEERLLECALRLAADPSPGRRSAAMKLAERRFEKKGSSYLRSCVLLLGLQDTDERVKEEALLACRTTCEQQGRREQARLLQGVSRLLAEEFLDDGSDARLAALDAAYALLDALAKPALRSDVLRDEQVDLVLPPFPRRSMFAREGLQPLEQLIKSSAPPSPLPLRNSAPYQGGKSGPPSPRSVVSSPISPRKIVPGLALAKVAGVASAAGAATSGGGSSLGSSTSEVKRSPRLQQLLEKSRSGSPRSSVAETAVAGRVSPRNRSSTVVYENANRVSPRNRSSSVLVVPTSLEQNIEAPSEVLRMSPRAKLKDDDSSSDSDEN